ncbi:MAG: hypothetical protein K2L27_07840 [Muribaculaceae bacterium]|nr:hypothetical protein [Muribaculaceae bacterium]
MKRIFLFMAAAAAAMAVSAQSHVDRQRAAAAADVVYYELGGNKYTPEQVDSINRIVAEYYFDQFRGFQDPEAPYFMFMSKDSQLAMGIGGLVRMRGWYDVGYMTKSNGFSPYLITMDPAQRTSRDRLGVSPSGTGLFFRVIGRNKMLGHYQLYIEGNFNGYDHVGFQLKKAYATIGDVTVGYASSTFGDPAAQPPVIDAQGANNKISNTTVLLRYMHTFRSGWTAAVSVENPTTAVATDGVSTAAASTVCPDGAAFVQYAWGPTSHVRLSGIVRSVGYRDLISERTHRRAGWGVLLSATGHPADPLTVYATLNYGRGTSSMGGDLICGAYDLLPDVADPGHMYAPASLGWNLGLQYNFRPDIFASASFSQTRLYAREGTAGSEYKYGLWACANLFWNLTPRIQAGVEFDWGLRCNVDGYARSARRVGAMCQFTF